MNNKELAFRVKKGDDKAFEELYKIYEPSIRRIFYKNVHNKSNIDDLVMLTIVKIYRHIERYDGRVKFNTWVTSIAYNTLLDYYRKKRRQYKIMENVSESKLDYIENVSSEDADPEENTIISQNVDRVKEIMKQLKPYQRKILLLRFFKDHSYEQIAKELNIPLGTVKAQIYRSKEILFKKIKENEE